MFTFPSDADLFENASRLLDATREFCLYFAWDYCNGKYTTIDEEHFDDFEVTGFSKLKIGGARICFLKDGIVYKVDYSAWIDPSNAQNDNEFDNYMRLVNTPLPRNWHIPAMDCVQVGQESVLVSEYIARGPDDITGLDLVAFMAATDIFDEFGDNYLTDKEGRFYFIDLAY